jgi:3-oxoacyl-[acyl-carrier protein] reductase
MSDRTTVGRTGGPDDIANAVAFPAAPGTGFVTAQVLTVDGGRMDYIGTAEDCAPADVCLMQW